MASARDISGVAGTIIWTEDFPRLLSFYRDVLGLKPRSVKADFANFQWGTFRLSIGRHSQVKGANRDPHRVMLNFAVADIQDVHSRLAAAGVRFVRRPEKEKWGGQVATFQDPDGNMLQLLELPGRAKQSERRLMGLRNFEMESAVEVNTPPERVWQLVADVRHWPEWSHVCTGVWDVPDGPLRPGRNFGFRLRMAGMDVPFYVTATEVDAYRRLSWKSTRYCITAVRSHEFAAAANGRTLVRDRKLFSSRVLPVGLWYPRWLIRGMTEAWLRELKAEAERAS